MSKSVKAKLDDLLPRESHLLRKQKNHKIRAAIEAPLYGAEMVSTTKRRQFQVRLNGARQAATTWSDAVRQKAMEGLEREIDQVTPPKRKLFDKLFQNMNDNYYTKLELRQPVPETYSPKNLP